MILLPPSKSIGARFLVASYFAGTLPADPLFIENDDLMVIQKALLEVYSDEEPIDYGDSPIDVESSGTALRFVMAVCASCPGADYVITGTNRLMQRPMVPIINLLKEAGAYINCLGDKETGPYRVKGNKLKGGFFSIRGDISSQFISALMLVAPVWENGLKLSFTTPLVSSPYVEMTARIMAKFDIKVHLSDKEVIVQPGNYKVPEGFQVEADWSSASFFYEATALGAKDVILKDLSSPQDSLQGDAATDEIFGKIGIVSNFSKAGMALVDSGKYPDYINIDFKDYPDLVLPFAVACLCKDIKFHFDGVANLRLKESDRIASLQKEAIKLGFVIDAGENFIEWKRDTVDAQSYPLITTHDDHRVAMAFAMTALKFGEIKIEYPEVVEKSFIDFWNHLPLIGLQCHQEGNIMIVTRN